MKSIPDPQACLGGRQETTNSAAGFCLVQSKKMLLRFFKVVHRVKGTGDLLLPTPHTLSCWIYYNCSSCMQGKQKHNIMTYVVNISSRSYPNMPVYNYFDWSRFYLNRFSQLHQEAVVPKEVSKSMLKTRCNPELTLAAKNLSSPQHFLAWRRMATIMSMSSLQLLHVACSCSISFLGIVSQISGQLIWLNIQAPIHPL